MTWKTEQGKPPSGGEILVLHNISILIMIT